MNTLKITTPASYESAGNYRLVKLAVSIFMAAMISIFVTGCSKEKVEDPVVSVTAAKVKTGTVQRIVEADAVLFPLQQAAIVPKLTAPVKQFYVKRGSKVHKGQLLAVLENQDLAAAKEENRGAFEQAEAAYVTSTAASLPEEVQKATSDTQFAKEQLDAQQKLYDGRQELFKQGALPRKDLDQAAVVVAPLRLGGGMRVKVLDALGAGKAVVASRVALAGIDVRDGEHRLHEHLEHHRDGEQDHGPPDGDFGEVGRRSANRLAERRPGGRRVSRRCSDGARHTSSTSTPARSAFAAAMIFVCRWDGTSS